jgi:hypothetical protein
VTSDEKQVNGETPEEKKEEGSKTEAAKKAPTASRDLAAFSSGRAAFSHDFLKINPDGTKSNLSGNNAFLSARAAWQHDSFASPVRPQSIKDGGLLASGRDSLTRDVMSSFIVPTPIIDGGQLSSARGSAGRDFTTGSALASPSAGTRRPTARRRRLAGLVTGLVIIAVLATAAWFWLH